MPSFNGPSNAPWMLSAMVKSRPLIGDLGDLGEFRLRLIQFGRSNLLLSTVSDREHLIRYSIISLSAKGSSFIASPAVCLV